MKIRYIAAARRDLIHLRRYVTARFDERAWSLALGELSDAVALVADQPRLGSIPPELEELGIDRYRELTIGRNRVVYEPRVDAVFIILVVNHRRDFRAALARRLLEPPTEHSGD